MTNYSKNILFRYCHQPPCGIRLAHQHEWYSWTETPFNLYPKLGRIYEGGSLEVVHSNNIRVVTCRWSSNIQQWSWFNLKKAFRNESEVAWFQNKGQRPYFAPNIKCSRSPVGALMSSMYICASSDRYFKHYLRRCTYFKEHSVSSSWPSVLRYRSDSSARANTLGQNPDHVSGGIEINYMQWRLDRSRPIYNLRTIHWDHSSTKYWR